MGLCIINIASFFYIDKEFENIDDINCLAQVISIKEEKEYKNKYVVRIIQYKENNNIENQKVIIYTSKTKELLPGDIVKIKGIFSKADLSRNFGGFDYSKYLKQFKIYGIINVEEFLQIGKKKTIITEFELLRKKFLDKINSLYTTENSGFLKSLLFGKNDEISEEIKINFRDSNISHVLAISGMHVSYIIISLKTIFDKIIKNKKIKNYILISCLIVFSIVTGNSTSGIRACIMMIMIFLASNFERKNNFYLSFAYSLLIIITYNPYNIYNIGLWLSYMGTLGIVIFSNFFKRYIYYKLKKRKQILKVLENKNNIILVFEKIKYFLLENILENFIVTISAQFLIFPIVMYVFNTLSLSFFVSNILISFLVGPILILGYISIILSYLRFPFENVIIFIEEFLIQILLNISKLCTQLPFSKIYVVTPNFSDIIIFYLIISVFIYFFHKKKIYFIKLLISYKFIKKEKNRIISLILKKINKDNKKLIMHTKIIFLVIVIIYFFIHCSCYLSNKGNLEINFVDVGQGDCTYIKTPKGKNIIIDGGEGNTGKYDYGENVVLPYLLDKKVKKIDYLIISHADSDHIGGLFAIIENMKIENIIIGVQPEISTQYLELKNIAKRKKIKIFYISSKNKLKIENNIFLEFLWPIQNNFIEENPLNNNSLVFRFCYNEFSILFTGDIEIEAEEQIVKYYDKTNFLKSTVLKVSHHGSKTSTISYFLERISPQIALIGVGKDNNFGHPNKEVIERLRKQGVSIFRTDENGEINIFVKKSGKFKIKTKY